MTNSSDTVGNRVAHCINQLRYRVPPKNHRLLLDKPHTLYEREAEQQPMKTQVLWSRVIVLLGISSNLKKRSSQRRQTQTQCRFPA